MKLFKDYTKETYSFLVNDTTLSSDNKKTSIIKISISKKIKAINNKIEQNKAQYSLDRDLLRFLLDHQEMLVNMNFN